MRVIISDLCKEMNITLAGSSDDRFDADGRCAPLSGMFRLLGVASGRARGRHRAAEGGESDGVGASDEQHPKSCRGNRPRGADL